MALCAGCAPAATSTIDAAVDIHGVDANHFSDSNFDATSTLGDMAAGARDWSAHPPIAELDAAGELWVTSDIHGDLGAITALLTGAGLVDGGLRWKAGTAVLVIVGDLIDKGPDAVGVVRLLIALQSSAAAAGGRVLVTMGNHEAEFLADPRNSKASDTQGFDPQLLAADLGLAATAAGSDDVGAFIRDLPFAARVGDWFFAHAGNTDGKSLAGLAAALRSGVDASGFGAAVLADASSLLEAKLSSGVFWEGGADPQKTLAAFTQSLGVAHLVMGHQPGAVTFADGTTREADQIFQRYGLIFLVDTGMSAGVDDTGGALLHVPDPGDATTATVVWPDGHSKPLRAK